MAFGNASLPTRKYVYGARATVPGVKDDKGKSVLFPGHDAAVEQLFKAHRLQNKLVEIERKRREEANAIIHAAFPDLAQLLADAEALDAEVEGLRTELKRLNSASRSKTANREFAAQVRVRTAARSAAWQAYRVRKDQAWGDTVVRAALDENDTRSTALCTAARTEAVGNGLYWGTSLLVMQRVKKSGPPPQFKRWCGEGLIGVQFQRKPDKNSPRVPVLNDSGEPKIHPRSRKQMLRYEGGTSQQTDTITARNSLCWIEAGEHPKHVTIHFRVGSDGDGRALWASLPTVLHRELPKNAEVKWAYLIRRKIGTHYKWEVQFDVAMSEDAWTIRDGLNDAKRGPKSPLFDGRAEHGTVAVALGWRKIGDEIRVASWVGSDGKTGEVTIPRERVGKWVHCDERLQHNRDQLFDRQRALLVEWLRGRELPQEWRDRIQSLPLWRSGPRLASLVLWWRNHRLPDDDEILRQMEGERVLDGEKWRYTGGRKQDKHLTDWEGSARQNCQGWRKWFYRDVALRLASMYSSVVIAEIDWHAIAENPEPEELDEKVNKRYRGIAACASLRDELTDCMERIAVPAPGITVTCHACGATCQPPGRGRWVTCERCGGEPMDRTDNAARNLLARGLGLVEVE